MSRNSYSRSQKSAGRTLELPSGTKMKNHFFRSSKIGIVAIFLSSITLAGCSNFQAMEKLNFFSKDTPRSCAEKVGVKGRFSIRYKVEGRDESLHGGFDWKQSPDYTVITLLSPLGQSMARIDVTPRLTTFIAPGNAPRSAANSEELIKSELGWTLPVTGLKDWLQGCAVDMQGQAFIATPESRQVITKDGWQINYATWIDGPSMPLPKRIDMIKGSPDSQNVDINLKLVIDEWHF